MKRFIYIISILMMSVTACNAESTDKSTPEAKGEQAATVNPKVKIETTMGDITIELDAKNAPNSTENFISYVKDGHYDGTVFHRVIPKFMVQGGGFDTKMVKKPTKAPIKNEANNGLKNTKGTVAMARTRDPHSASAQFYINVNDNSFLDFKSETASGWGYAVFGKVVDGMDVVEKIEAVKTETKQVDQLQRYPNSPSEAIVMKKVTVIE